MDHKKAAGKEVAKTTTCSPAIQALHLTALFVGDTIWQYKQQRTFFVSVCVALAEFRFCCLGKHFYGTKHL
jgi:hypothetical protein